MSYRVDEAANMEELMRMMRAEDARLRGESVSTPQVEQDTLESAGSRQIAHAPVDKRAQMDHAIQHGHKSIEDQVSLKAKHDTVFAAEHAQQHSQKPRGQHFGVRVGGNPQKQPAQSEDPIAGVANWEITEKWITDVLNPRTKQMADNHGFDPTCAQEKFETALGQRKASPTDVDEQFFDAAEEARMHEEFFPDEVVSGPTGVWNTDNLEPNKQVTATMVNPLDERLKKA